jgi:hypothetical protein
MSTIAPVTKTSELGVPPQAAVVTPISRGLKETIAGVGRRGHACCSVHPDE